MPPHSAWGFGLALVLACAPAPPARASGGCAFDQPVRRMLLAAELREISGLAVTPSGDLLAHDDEVGIVHVLDPVTGAVAHRYVLDGAPRGDFEGIAAVGDSIVLMTSTGFLFAFLPDPAGAPSPYAMHDTGLGRLCELEGLAWDAVDRVFLLPCKTSRRPGVEPGLVVFRWSPGEARLADPPALEVPPGTLRRWIGSPSLRPTAVEVDSVLDRILVLSARPQVIVELDRTGTVRSAGALRPALHPQPEGLTLLPGALLVADEGGAGQATLTVYACRG